MEVYVLPDGGRRAAHNGVIIASTDEDDVRRCREFAKAIYGLRARSIAHIGLGFGVLASILGPGYDHTYFEITPVPVEHRPTFGTLVEGDYATTIRGQFDVVVYDLGDTPAIDLTAHLNPGGQLLGVD